MSSEYDLLVDDRLAVRLALSALGMSKPLSPQSDDRLRWIRFPLDGDADDHERVDMDELNESVTLVGESGDA